MLVKVNVISEMKTCFKNRIVVERCCNKWCKIQKILRKLIILSYLKNEKAGEKLILIMWGPKQRIRIPHSKTDNVRKNKKAESIRIKTQPGQKRLQQIEDQE